MRGLLALLSVFCVAGLSRATTTTTFDVLAATETLTVVGTTTFMGNGFSVGGSTLVASHGYIGIGTTTPVALLNLVAGPIQGNGVQFQWIASSAALRLGEITGAQWAPSNIGVFSNALGFNNQASGAFSTVNGGSGNTADNLYNVVAGGLSNSTFFQYSTVGGGTSDEADGFAAVVSGGQDNFAEADYATVGGGYSNDAGAGAVVCGGGYDGSNKMGNGASGAGSAVVGGLGNRCSGFESFIGGGNANSIGGSCQYSTLSGGYQNVVTGSYSSMSGGSGNTVSGSYATVPGGFQNTASGLYSFAAGQQSSATAQGSFVWSDSQNEGFVSNVNDEFKIRAQGGFVFFGNGATPTVIVSSGAILISTSASAGSAVPNLFVSSNTGGIGIGTSSPATTLDVNGSAQFGSGAQKSTFTATGSLSVPYGVTAATGAFTASGANASVTASSVSITGASGEFALTVATGAQINGPLVLGLGAYVQYYDGSVSTTASIGGGSSCAGCAQLASTQTFTAPNTFASTLAYRGSNGLGIAPGMMVEVSSGLFSAVNVASVSLPSGYSFFHIVASLKNVSGASKTLMVNVGTDTSVGYAWSENSNASNPTSCTSAGYVSMTYPVANATNWENNTWATFSMDIMEPASNVLNATYSGSSFYSSTNQNWIAGGFQYVGGSMVDGINFYPGVSISCSARTPAANGIAGVIHVFAMPF